MTPQSILAALTPDQVQNLVDHAAVQSDRWLFLSTACAFGLCLAIAVVFQTRWVQALVNELRDDRKALGDIVRDNTIELVRFRDKMDNKR